MFQQHDSAFPTETVAIAVLLQLAFTAGLVAWGKWVARRQGNGRGWQLAARLPWAGLVFGLAGTALTVALLVRAFSAIEHSDPSEKARLLADGIRDAMIPTALLAPLSWLSYLVGFGFFVVGSAMSPKRRPAE